MKLTYGTFQNAIKPCQVFVVRLKKNVLYLELIEIYSRLMINEI